MEDAEGRLTQRADDGQMNELLMRALVNTLAFLELSEDDVVDPDSAVKVLEHAAHLLGRVGQGRPPFIPRARGCRRA